MQERTSHANRNAKRKAVERTDNKKEISSLAKKLREREVTINSLNEQLQLPTNPNPNLLEPQIPTRLLAASPDLQQPSELQTNLNLPYKQQRKAIINSHKTTYIGH